MAIEDIEIYETGIDRPYKEIGPIKVKVGARTALSKSKTIEDVNKKLESRL